MFRAWQDLGSRQDRRRAYPYRHRRAEPDTRAARRTTRQSDRLHDPRDRLDPPGTEARALLTHGRYDRMVPFNVSIAILNHIADWHLMLLNNCASLAALREPAEWPAQVVAFLRSN